MNAAAKNLKLPHLNSKPLVHYLHITHLYISN